MRFKKLPWAPTDENPVASYYCCEECDERDYVDTFNGGQIREFYHDTELGELICEVCKVKREGQNGV